MIKIIVSFIIFIFLLFISLSFILPPTCFETRGMENSGATAYIRQDEKPFNEVAEAPEIIIRRYSEIYGLSADRMIKIAFCESSLREKVIGDNGKSFGLWQIQPKLHKLSEDCVLDAECSTRWAIEKIAQGKGFLWTCYQLTHSSL